MQCALHHFGIGIYRQLLVGQFQLELPAVLGADGVVPFAHLIAELAHIKMYPLAPVGTAGHLTQFHHAGHQRGQPVGFVHDDIHLFVPVLLVITGDVAHRFGVALDEGQRGAQVVRDVGQQVPLHLGGVLHFSGHVVEVAGQIAQLVAAAAVHMDGIVAQCHLAGSAGKLAQGLGEPLAEEPRCRQCKDEDQCCSHRQYGAQHFSGFCHMHQTGGDQNGVLAAGGHAPHQKLCRAGQPGRVQGLDETVCGAALLAHGHSSGNDHVVVGRV